MASTILRLYFHKTSKKFPRTTSALNFMVLKAWVHLISMKWNSYFKARQEKLKHKIFLCPFGPPPAPLVCIVHLQYALTRPPPGQKYLLNHDDLFFFWCQPCNSLGDNITYDLINVTNYITFFLPILEDCCFLHYQMYDQLLIKNNDD